MEESNKLPLKRVELSLSKFNEVAIPHHLDLLRQHRVNIIKYESQGEYARVRSEQVHARRVAQQLRALLAELEALRRRVRPEDRPRFDELTQRSRDLTLKAIVDYLDMPGAAARRAPSPARGAGSLTSLESVGLVTEDDDRLQLHVDDSALALEEREAVLRGWSALAGDVRALHDAWQTVQAAALHQREDVATAAGDVDLAADNVLAARGHLSAAERLRAGAWAVGGAAAGALAGGPVGLAAGLKAGALAALAGSLLGALAARALGRRVDTQPAPSAPADPADKDKNA